MIYPFVFRYVVSLSISWYNIKQKKQSVVDGQLKQQKHIGEGKNVFDTTTSRPLWKWLTTVDLTFLFGSAADWDIYERRRRCCLPADNFTVPTTV